nr:unnamed protein product [Digitaria exilis]
MAPMVVVDTHAIVVLLMNSPLHIRSTTVKPKYSGDKSGRTISPSRYCMTSRMPKFQYQRYLVRVKPVSDHRVRGVDDRSSTPTLSYPIHEHAVIPVLVLLDWPSSTGDLQKECPKRKDICRRSCLAGVA